MVETCAGPSELHLKKELSTLQKARVLRDPGTHTSWKTVSSSNSFRTTVNLNDTNENSGNPKGVNSPNGSSELFSGFEKRRKKVYLYNWGNHSSKFSDSGLKLDDDSRQSSGQASPQADLDTNMKLLYSMSDSQTEFPHSLYGVESKNPVRRTSRKLNRVALTRRKINRNSKPLDISSKSVRGHGSAELSDLSGYFSSDEMQQSKYGLMQKLRCCSQHASLMTSSCGCGNSSNRTSLRVATRKDDLSHSCTPASNRSYNIHGAQILSTGGSSDKTSASLDGDGMLHIRRNQICGLLPCSNEENKPDLKGYSCSESDTSSRRVRSICGSHTMHSKRRPSSSQKHKYVPKSSQGVPLLTNRFDVVGSSTDSATDELASTFGEIDLEAVSRLDGQIWSRCRSQEGAELALPEGFDSEMVEHNSLSQKYRPRTFGEIVGHNIVVQSLNNAVLRGKVAHTYLFQGPHGTGKTSTARIFAAALNCLSTEEDRPCGFCSKCTDAAGNVSYLTEVDATNKKGIERMRRTMRKISRGETFCRYKVFVIDECHLLSSKSWSGFMNFLDEPLSCIVFIFITIDPDSLPRAVVSGCQKYHFPKIRDADIALRLSKLAMEENLDVELDALDLIALNSDGSLQDAETMLEQSSLLGKRITTNLVNHLVGLVPNERLLDLLELSLSSNTAETVKRSRELIESGVDPIVLVSQLAGLIMDIIAGTSQLPSSQSSGKAPGVESLTDAEVERLQKALKILSDAKKQLKHSSERPTWFTAALLQLSSGQSTQPTPSRSSSRQNIERFHEGASEKFRETSSSERKSSPLLGLHKSSPAATSRVTSGRCSTSTPKRSLDNTDDAIKERFQKCRSPDMLDNIWRRCIERFDSERLRHLLYANGKLVSIQETKGVLIAYIAFGDGDIKSSAERFLSSITDSIRIVLRHDVEVRIGLVPEKYLKALDSVPDSPSSQHTDTSAHLDKVGKQKADRLHRFFDTPRKNMESSEIRHRATPVIRTRGIGIHEQSLDSAWLRASGRVGDSTAGRFERDNDSLHRNDVSFAFPDLSGSFKKWEDGPRDEIYDLETNKSLGHQKEHIRESAGDYHHAISPSFLHSNSFKSKNDQASSGYESGPSRCGFCCWKTSKPRRGKVKRGNVV